MFSIIFGKKKPSPSTPPEEAIPGPDSGPPPPAQSNEDFIFVERKSPADDPAPSNAHSMYPPMPAAPFNYGGGGSFYPPAVPFAGAAAKQPSTVPVPFYEGIPLKLAPELCTKTSFDVMQMEVDGILALMTKQMQVDEDYEFKLEREILSQYAAA